MKAKKELMKLEPYRGETSKKELARIFNLREEDILPLHVNENLFVEKEWVRARVREALEKIDPRMYPDPQNLEVREALAEHYGVSEEEVVIGNGADELIDCVCKCFIEKNDQVITLDPTFQVYSISAMLYGGKHKSVLLEKESFAIDVAKILSKLNKRTKVVYICSPNNPTGNQHGREIIEKVLEEANCIVVLDEAYVEFADYSLSKLIHNYDNLVVLRTFSKVGIAGLRFGVALSNREIADAMRRALQPYNVSSIAQYTAITLLENWDYIAEKIEEVKKQRERLQEGLAKIEGVKVYPSKANFILIRITKRGLTALEVQRKLMTKGILVRDRSSLPLLENCLRITVCPSHMAERLLSALREALD